MCYICIILQNISLGTPPVFRDHLLAQLNCLSPEFVYCRAGHLDVVLSPPVHSNCGQLSHGPRSGPDSQTSLFLCFCPFTATVICYPAYDMADEGLLSLPLVPLQRLLDFQQQGTGCYVLSVALSPSTRSFSVFSTTSTMDGILLVLFACLQHQEAQDDLKWLFVLQITLIFREDFSLYVICPFILLSLVFVECLL